MDTPSPPHDPDTHALGSQPAGPGSGLDVAATLARFDGDRVLLGEMVDLFLQDFPPRLAALRAAVERRDAAVVNQLAHLLRGSIANFEARPAVTLALHLELMGRSGDLSGIETAMADFERITKQLTVDLTPLLPGVL